MVSSELTWRVAVIGDVVASRAAEDRVALHEHFLEALASANAACAPIDPLMPTVGDEFQGTFDNVFGALDATLFVRVSLPIEYDVRFGVGVGPVLRFGGRRDGFPHQDGPAWWVARDAIEYVASTRRAVPNSLRTWIAAARSADMTVRVHSPVDLDERPVVCALNAFLATRDHLIGEMDGRDRRIMRDLLLAKAVKEIASAEGVTSSAVSQRVSRSGAAAILAARDLLRSGLWSTAPERARSRTGADDAERRNQYPSLEEVFAT